MVIFKNDFKCEVIIYEKSVNVGYIPKCSTGVCQICILDKIGLIFHQAGFDPLGFLRGDNLIVHIDSKD